MSKSASGSGGIRKKTVRRGGKDYVYWEARYTAGYDPATGRQIQRSITGKTQREVARRLREATAQVEAGNTSTPEKLTVAGWMERWESLYLVHVKPLTVKSYQGIIRNHITPGIGSVRLSALTTDIIQGFYNTRNVAPKTLSCIHGVLHKALQQAVKNKLIPSNPANGCVLPRVEKPTISPLDAEQIGAFLRAIQGHKFEHLYTVILFLGLRESEALGLPWDAVDLEAGTVTIRQQLLAGSYTIQPTKNSGTRTLTAAPYVIRALRAVRAEQLQNRIRYAQIYQDSGLVFTNELGGHLYQGTVYKHFKKIVASIGLPDTRLHDLRHSFAVASLEAGDDIKTVQENLGHATAAFTLDVYGHVTEDMKKASAQRMENYIRKAVGK